MSESEGGSSGVAGISPDGWAKSDAGCSGGDVAVDAGGLVMRTLGALWGLWASEKKNGLGKSKYRVNRALGFSPGRFGSLTGAFPVT